MAITKYSDISSFVAAIYERSVFVAREMNLMSNLVSNYSAQGWMTRTFSTRPQISAETVADGVDYSNPTTFGKSAVGTLTPAEAIAQVILTDQDIETDPDGAVNDAAYELMHNIHGLIQVGPVFFYHLVNQSIEKTLFVAFGNRMQFCVQHLFSRSVKCGNSFHLCHNSI